MAAVSNPGRALLLASVDGRYCNSFGNPGGGGGGLGHPNSSPAVGSAPGHICIGVMPTAGTAGALGVGVRVAAWDLGVGVMVAAAYSQRLMNFSTWERSNSSTVSISERKFYYSDFYTTGTPSKSNY